MRLPCNRPKSDDRKANYIWEPIWHFVFRLMINEFHPSDDGQEKAVDKNQGPCETYGLGTTVKEAGSDLPNYVQASAINDNSNCGRNSEATWLADILMFFALGIFLGGLFGGITCPSFGINKNGPFCNGCC
jgi:hypothetical protein